MPSACKAAILALLLSAPILAQQKAPAASPSPTPSQAAEPAGKQAEPNIAEMRFQITRSRRELKKMMVVARLQQKLNEAQIRLHITEREDAARAAAVTAKAQR